MKRAKFLNTLLASILIAAVAGGCKKNPKNITPIPASQRGFANNPNLSDPLRGGDASRTIPTENGLSSNISGNSGDIATPIAGDEDRAALAQQTIYFDFDRSAIKPSEMPKLEQVATFLKSTPGVQLKIEGHCDERGTEEYNRSLGERRANSAREILIQKHGIDSGRITTASFGEDKPVSLEKTEEAYAKNRRDEFIILRPR